MAECNVWDCRKEVTRRLIVAMETDDGAAKITLFTCTGHGDGLDDKPGTYLVTDSQAAY